MSPPSTAFTLHWLTVLIELMHVRVCYSSTCAYQAVQCELHCDAGGLLIFCGCRQLRLRLLDLRHLNAVLVCCVDGKQQRRDVDLMLRWLGEVVKILTSRIALLSQRKPHHSDMTGVTAAAELECCIFAK